MNRCFFIAAILFLGISLSSYAQIAAGVYRLSSATFASIGTDPEQKIFGEARVSTGGRVGIEGTFGYNFVQNETVNFYSGFHLGNQPSQNLYLGIPLGLLVKPFAKTENVGFLMEASPIFPTGSGNYFRAGLGIKYVFR
ncbi:glycyl-tRNA synthetase [Lunatimonas lonarensis]|uniref:Glycyl-tRNA synthetase n=1 Tax=Lunatimonas lonarensis TaxID=1232681 RepID=R7ZV96_9BACT|nr:hypothetical protein [Lunatimonas lonarensis]EON78007.1 glycyl-tRNA synthetase [Lunatimonas lonarensis]